MEFYIDPIGVIYSKDKKCLLVFPHEITIQSYEVLESCEEIASNAFKLEIIETGSCYDDLEVKGNSLTKLILPKQLKKIGDLAFYGCLSLDEIEIPASVYEIGRSPFVGCNELRNLCVHPNNIVYDSRDNCNAIIETKSGTLIQGTNFTIIPQTVKHIGNNAFGNCLKIESIEIPESVYTIGDGTFFDCRSLKEIVFPSSIRTIGEGALARCMSLNHIVLQSSIIGFSYGTVEDCDNLGGILVNMDVYNYYENIFSFTPLIAILKVNLLFNIYIINGNNVSFIDDGVVKSTKDLFLHNNSSLYFFRKIEDHLRMIGNGYGELLGTTVTNSRNITVVKETLKWILIKFGDGYYLLNREFQIVYSTIPSRRYKDWAYFIEDEVVVIDGMKRNDFAQKCDLLSDNYWDNNIDVHYRCYIDFSGLQIICIEELPLYTLEIDDYSLAYNSLDELGQVYRYNSTSLQCVSPCKIYNEEGQFVAQNVLIHSFDKNYNSAYNYLFPDDCEYTKIDCYASKDGFEAIAYMSNNERYYAYRYSLEHKFPQEILSTYIIIKLFPNISLDLYAHKYANLSEYYPYLIINKESKYGVLLKGKQILPSIYDKISFVNKEAIETDILYYDHWYYERDKVVTYRNKENVYICADNLILDYYGNIVQKWDNCFKLLDTWDNYIAYLCYDRSIRIYRIYPFGKYSINENENDYFTYRNKKYTGICESIPYLLVKIDGKNYLEVSSCYCNSGTNPFFDLETNEFTINPRIDPKKMPKRPQHHIYDSYNLIEDGLDGFPDAIWNID